MKRETLIYDNVTESIGLIKGKSSVDVLHAAAAIGAAAATLKEAVVHAYQPHHQSWAIKVNIDKEKSEIAKALKRDLSKAGVDESTIGQISCNILVATPDELERLQGGKEY